MGKFASNASMAVLADLAGKALRKSTNSLSAVFRSSGSSVRIGNPQAGSRRDAMRCKKTWLLRTHRSSQIKIHTLRVLDGLQKLPAKKTEAMSPDMASRSPIEMLLREPAEFVAISSGTDWNL